MTYDNTKIHEEAGIHLFSRRYFFRKTMERGVKSTELKNCEIIGTTIEPCDTQEIHFDVSTAFYF